MTLPLRGNFLTKCFSRIRKTTTSPGGQGCSDGRRFSTPAASRRTRGFFVRATCSSAGDSRLRPAAGTTLVEILLVRSPALDGDHAGAAAHPGTHHRFLRGHSEAVFVGTASLRRCFDFPPGGGGLALLRL